MEGLVQVASFRSLAPLLLTIYVVLLLFCYPEEQYDPTPTIFISFLPCPALSPSFFPCDLRLGSWKQSGMTFFGRSGFKVKQSVQRQAECEDNQLSQGGDFWGRGGAEDL